MLSKVEQIKEIAHQYGKLSGKAEYNYCIEADYYNDVSIVLALNNAGLSYKRNRSLNDCEKFFYLID